MKQKETDIITVKELIMEKINSEYGSLTNFLKTNFAKSLGREKNIRTYLYPSGAVSFPVLAKLCKHLSIGELEKDVVVTRTITYSIKKKGA